MVKKRNRRTRKKYIKRGGVSSDDLRACNVRLKSQGVKNMVERRKMCIESDGEAGKEVEEPAPIQPVQPIAEPKEPTELKQSSGVESVIAPLEEEPEQPTQPVQGPGVQSVIAPLEEEPKKPKKPSIKDRASALEKKFGETGMRKTRKALDKTVGACRAAFDYSKNKIYYYNEAKEVTWDPTDEVCHPKDGIEKTGRKVGDCIEARYKGGPAYLYHPTKQFSTHNMNHPDCQPVEGIYKTGVDSELPFTPGIEVKKSAPQHPQETKKVEEEKKSSVDCSELSNTKCKKSPDCDLVTTTIKGNTNNKKNKKKKCLRKSQIGGKRTKRKKSRKRRTKRKKSRKRRR